jgi:hypothetical protein
MRQLLLYKWERDAPDAGPAHCSLPYICLCGASSVIYGFLGVTFVILSKGSILCGEL